MPADPKQIQRRKQMRAAKRAETSEVVAGETAAQQPTPRVRQRGDAIKCAECGGDCFAYNSKTIRATNRPAFVHRGGTRVTYYRCDVCGTTTQRAREILF